MVGKEFILVAEDDDDDQHMLQTVFDDKKYNTPLKFVNNGLELISYLEAIHLNKDNLKFPKFILLDLNMPKMDGRQALKEIKNHPVFKKIPIVVFSTTQNKVEINSCYELGANTYVVKPASYNNLVIAVDTINSYWLNIASIPSGS